MFGDGDPYTYGIFFILVFVWLGIGHPQRTSLAFAVPVGAAYVLPLAAAGVPSAMTSVAVTIPVGVLVGESLAFLNERLRRTERALRESEQLYARAYEREREAAEQLRSLDEMKNAFLQAVSHELRTPLAVVLGGALTLKRMEELSTAERREIVDTLAVKARKLDRLVADLLDVDRLARGVLRPRREPVDLSELVARVVAELDAPADRVLAVEVRPVTALADAAKVERILENLLANALKHTPDGSPIWVRSWAEPEGVVLAVEDAGPGVPPEDRARIFEPFGQGADRVEHAPGVGMGLALVARFAELLGSSAWVEERDGGGASFRVRLPRAGEARRVATRSRTG